MGKQSKLNRLLKKATEATPAELQAMQLEMLAKCNDEHLLQIAAAAYEHYDTQTVQLLVQHYSTRLPAACIVDLKKMLEESGTQLH